MEEIIEELVEEIIEDGLIKEIKPEKEEKKPLPRRKIIYVDDLSHHLLTTQHRLKEFYEIYPAQTSEILFEIIDNITPELILLDINMPEVNGYDIIKMLKENANYAGIPVIFLTGNSDKDSINKALKLGAADFIMKPYSVPELVDAIEFQLDPDKQIGVKPSILAIDDDPSILQSINSMLSDEYTVYTVPGVGNEKAIHEILKKLTPDLFLLDCNMPGLSGIEIVQAVRDIPFYEDTPIVFLTSDGTRDNVYVALSANLNGFIVKPVDKQVLRDKMAELLKDFMKVRRIRTIHASKV